jgi:hypothetical protein
MAVILLLLFQLLWRYLSPALKETDDAIEVGPLTVPISVLASLSNALHPWVLSDRALWILAIILSLAFGILGLSPLSPFPPPPERTPIVQSFSVEYLERDETTGSFKPGNVVEINAGEQVLVQAQTLGQDSVLCTWSATNGSLLSADGCATLYSAPFYGIRDVLDIQAQSPCKTQSANASLHVKVISSDQ